MPTGFEISTEYCRAIFHTGASISDSFRAFSNLSSLSEPDFALNLITSILSPRF